MKERALDFCEKILKRVSRSFALTIPMLDEEIYKTVMITYLQDRLLDNFEDEIREGEISTARQQELMDTVVAIFTPGKDDHQSEIDYIKGNAGLINDRSLRRLTENIDLIYEAHEKYVEDEIKYCSYKWLIEMNKGMKKFIGRDIETFDDLDHYCYYVAGTVGGFLTDTIIYYGELSHEKETKLLANFKDAGLFLQKINLVRDVKKDLNTRNKHFWPLSTLELNEEMLLDENYKDKTVSALDKMLADIRRHIAGLLEYFQALPDNLPGYKKFFAVNNALGLATFDKLKNNDRVFYGSKKVKVSKIEFLKIIKSPEREFKERCHQELWKIK